MNTLKFRESGVQLILMTALP